MGGARKPPCWGGPLGTPHSTLSVAAVPSCPRPPGGPPWRSAPDLRPRKHLWNERTGLKKAQHSARPCRRAPRAAGANPDPTNCRRQANAVALQGGI